MSGGFVRGGQGAEHREGGRSYPPAPWELFGQAQVFALLVWAERLVGLPAGFRPLRLGPFALVLAGFIDYTGGSVLRYSELYVAPLGFREGHRRPVPTVTHMWVDSEASRLGGRELWGYPKELATFKQGIWPGGSASAEDGHGRLASATLRPLIELPFRVRFRGGTVQPLGGKLTPVRALIRGRPVLGVGRFSAAPEGPLAFLAKAKTVFAGGFKDFHFTFGI